MAWDERLPLKRYIRQQSVVDAQMRKALLQAANDAKRLLATLDPTSVRAIQLQLQQQQLRLWANLGTVIDEGISANGRIVADVNNQYVKELLARMGLRPSDELARSLLAQAESTVRNYLARQNLGMTLSERVYKNGQVASGRIDRVVNNGLLRGSSAREIARDVAALINPNTPGGVSYAAMRLGRTELNNSFHEVSTQSYSSNPFVNKVEWHLSRSHPKPDDCDGLVGKYEPENVPDKPHPNCFCYITPAVMSLAEVERGMRSGRFDDFIDAQMTG